jgi:hypothetical protein
MLLHTSADMHRAVRRTASHMHAGLPARREVGSHQGPGECVPEQAPPGRGAARAAQTAPSRRAQMPGRGCTCSRSCSWRCARAPRTSGRTRSPRPPARPCPARPGRPPSAPALARMHGQSVMPQPVCTRCTDLMLRALHVTGYWPGRPPSAPALAHARDSPSCHNQCSREMHDPLHGACCRVHCKAYTHVC